MPTSPFDIRIKTIGGTDIGYMLWKDRSGRRTYAVHDATTISPRFLTEEQITQAQLPADIALTFPQTNWRRGIGGIRFDAKDPDVLADGTQVDVTEQGVLKLARETTASTVDGTHGEYVPSGFAVSGTQLWAFIGTDVHSWDFTNKEWDVKTQPVAATRVYRNGFNFNGNIYVPAWADDVGSSGSYVAADEPVSYLYKTPTAAQWSVITTAAQTLGGCKYMAIAGQSLWGGYWVDVSDSGVNSPTVNDSQTAISVGTTGAFAAGDVIRIDTELLLITAYSDPNLTTIRGYRGSVAASHSSGADIYDLAENAHHVRSTADGTSMANWSTETSVGDSGSPITGLVGVGDDLIVIKTDGIYRLEADGTVTNLRPELTAFGHNDFGKGAWAWNDLVFIPLHGGGLWELDTTNWAIRDISFSITMPDQTQYHGRVVAGHGEPNRLYVMVQETGATKYHILMTENPTTVGINDYNWTMVGSISYTTATDADHAALLLEAVTNGTDEHHRLWAGVESTGSNLLPYFITHDTHDDDDEYSSTNGEAYTVAFDAGFPNVLKRSQDIVCNTDNLGAAGGSNHIIEVRYRLEGTGNWLYVNSGTTSNTGNNSTLVSDNQTIAFSQGVTFYKIELRFTLDRKSTGDATTPELHDFALTCQLRPVAVKLLPLSFYLANGLALNNGMVENQAKTKRNQLRTWDTQGAEVVVTDTEGGTRNCVMLPGQMKESEVRNGYHQFPEYKCDVVLAEVG